MRLLRHPVRTIAEADNLIKNMLITYANSGIACWIAPVRRVSPLTARHDSDAICEYLRWTGALFPARAAHGLASLELTTCEPRAHSGMPGNTVVTAPERFIR